MKKEKFSGLGSGILFSLCFSFLVCIYAPFELFLTNISDFHIKVSEFLPVPLILFAGLSLISILGVIILKAISPKLYDIVLAVGAAGLLGMYIQGNFLIKNLPDMEGATVDWNAYPAERIKSIIVFVIPVIIFVALLIKLKSENFRKAVLAESGILLILFVVTLTSLFITTDTQTTETLIPTNKGEFEMSEDKNFVILLLDAVDSQKFKNEIEKRPDLKEALDGFTYYDDAMCAYPCTSRSIPLIFSGKWYENTEPFTKYLNESMDKSPVLNSLSSQGYNIGFYEENMELNKSISGGRFINYYTAKVSYNEEAFETAIKMGGVKFFPWDLKRFTWNFHKALIRIKDTGTGYDNYTWSNDDFYNTVTSQKPFTTVDTKCARYIHISGAHSPFIYNKNMKVISGGTYEDNVAASATIIEQYINALKKYGFYDNTAIVILADHGYNGQDIKNELKRMNPLFMVKGFGEKHTLKYSSAPISYIDLADGMTKLTTGSLSDSIFNTKENEKRTRRALLYRFNKENHMWEVLTDGKASDYNSIKGTGKNYDFKTSSRLFP